MKTASDTRLKVRALNGLVGAVEKVISDAYCTVQFHKGGYYVVCKIDDLTPITEEEFTRKWK